MTLSEDRWAHMDEPTVAPAEACPSCGGSTHWVDRDYVSTKHRCVHTPMHKVWGMNAPHGAPVRMCPRCKDYMGGASPCTCNRVWWAQEQEISCPICGGQGETGPPGHRQELVCVSCGHILHDDSEYSDRARPADVPADLLRREARLVGGHRILPVVVIDAGQWVSMRTPDRKIAGRWVGSHRGKVVLPCRGWDVTVEDTYYVRLDDMGGYYLATPLDGRPLSDML